MPTSRSPRGGRPGTLVSLRAVGQGAASHIALASDYNAVCLSLGQGSGSTARVKETDEETLNVVRCVVPLSENYGSGI